MSPPPSAPPLADRTAGACEMVAGVALLAPKETSLLRMPKKLPVAPAARTHQSSAAIDDGAVATLKRCNLQQANHVGNK